MVESSWLTLLRRRAWPGGVAEVAELPELGRVIAGQADEVTVDAQSAESWLVGYPPGVERSPADTPAPARLALEAWVVAPAHGLIFSA